MATQKARQIGTPTQGNRQVEDGEEDDLPDLEFTIVDRQVIVRAPGSGPLSYLAMAAASPDSDPQKFGSLLNVIANCMDEDDARYLQRMMLADKMGLEDLTGMVHEVLEEWGARPTVRSSDSSRRPGNRGPSSTASSRRRVSRPSGSPSTDS